MNKVEDLNIEEQPYPKDPPPRLCIIDESEGIKAGKDRTEIVKIFERMFDGVDDYGIYPTSTAYMQLEHYIRQERNIAIGCTHGACCAALDKGDDPRTVECSSFFADIENTLFS